MFAAGAGTWSISGNLVSTATCWPDEPDQGEIVLTGYNVATVALDGEVECDACSPWTSDDGYSGEMCWGE